MTNIPIEYLPLIGITFFSVLILVVVLQIWLERLWRQRQFSLMAEPLSLTYTPHQTALPTDNPELAATCLPGIKTQDVRHLLSGRWGQVSFYLFEYSYKVNGRPYHTNRQTILLIDLESANLSVPQFILRPRKRTDTMRERMGYTFLPLPNAKKERHSLLSFETEDNRVIERVGHITEDLWSKLESKQSHITANGRFLVYTCQGNLLKAKQSAVETFLNTGQELMVLLAQTIEIEET